VFSNALTWKSQDRLLFTAGEDNRADILTKSKTSFNQQMTCRTNAVIVFLSLFKKVFQERNTP